VPGVEVLTSDHPPAAFELLAKRQIDDDVADERMPEMDGMEFLERVKERHPYTVRMMLTGHGDPDTLTTAINREEVKRLLAKPWTEGELTEAVVEAIADLEDAVARLGNRRERSSRRSVPVRLWDHAVATAMASRALSAMTGQGDREEAYLAGLLHDCGRLLVLEGVDHLEGQDGVPEIGPALLDEMMDALGPKVGAQALRALTMPEAVCDAAAHAYDADADAMPRSALVVHVASAIARKIGAHPKPDPKLNLALVPATERLKIGAVALSKPSIQDVLFSDFVVQ